MIADPQGRSVDWLALEPGEYRPADNAGPIPARSIGPTHRRGTATINTGGCQRAPPISQRQGALFYVQRQTPVSPAHRSRATLPVGNIPKLTTTAAPTVPNLNDATRPAVPNSSDAQHLGSTETGFCGFLVSFDVSARVLEP